MVRRQKTGMRESLGQRPYRGFHEKAKRSRVNSLGQASLNISGELWGIGAVLCCLTSGLGVI